MGFRMASYKLGHLGLILAIVSRTSVSTGSAGTICLPRVSLCISLDI